MFFPPIRSWMKLSREFSGFRIDGGYVATFESVADSATQREIIRNRLTTMLHCDHVIDLMLCQRKSF